MTKIALLILIIFSCTTFSQTQTTPQTKTQPEPPPSTDIYLVDLSMKDGKLRVGEPINLTKRTGYDNQPSFFTDDDLYYTSIRNEQADIYSVNLKTNQTRQITNTPESEYSPTLTPDRKHISVVRVEADKTQRLWQFPLQGGAPTLVLKDIKPVGYHLWIDPNTLLLFILGEPPTLQRANSTTGKADRLAENIGRCFQRIPNSSAVSFVQKKDGDHWWIQQIEKQTWEVQPIVKALTTEDHDYVWTPDGTILSAQESKLFTFKLNKDSDWQLVTNFSDQRVKGITRLAVSPDGKKLALVAEE